MTVSKGKPDAGRWLSPHFFSFEIYNLLLGHISVKLPLVYMQLNTFPIYEGGIIVFIFATQHTQMKLVPFTLNSRLLSSLQSMGALDLNNEVRSR